MYKLLSKLKDQRKDIDKFRSCLLDVVNNQKFAKLLRQNDRHLIRTLTGLCNDGVYYEIIDACFKCPDRNVSTHLIETLWYNKIILYPLLAHTESFEYVLDSLKDRSDALQSYGLEKFANIVNQLMYMNASAVGDVVFHSNKIVPFIFLNLDRLCVLHCLIESIGMNRPRLLRIAWYGFCILRGISEGRELRHYDDSDISQRPRVVYFARKTLDQYDWGVNMSLAEHISPVHQQHIMHMLRLYLRIELDGVEELRIMVLKWLEQLKDLTPGSFTLAEVCGSSDILLAKAYQYAWSDVDDLMICECFRYLINMGRNHQRFTMWISELCCHFLDTKSDSQMIMQQLLDCMTVFTECGPSDQEKRRIVECAEKIWQMQSNRLTRTVCLDVLSNISGAICTNPLLMRAVETWKKVKEYSKNVGEWGVSMLEISDTEQHF